MIRIGHGYDVHKFCENRKCIIGGVEIPYEKGLLGHSDADVLLHAVCDALFFQKRNRFSKQNTAVNIFKGRIIIGKMLTNIAKRCGAQK